ncbi:hypothetical protein OG21DRAFT_955594 [Imleria badia]|nr:hypothetical protein OG21DRAFT_955594 [Imleria badia]
MSEPVAANPFASIYGTIFGPLFFSTLMSTGLYGVACMQTAHSGRFYYYVHYPNDSLRMKSFVAAMWSFNTIHVALTIAGVYKYIMATLVNPAAVLVEIPELAIQILSAATISMPTQGFFVYRIYIFSGKNIVAPILWSIQMIYQFVAAILWVAKSLHTVDGTVQAVGFTELTDSFFTNLTISSLALAAGVDILIAIAMTFLLFQSRSATGFASTVHILQRLIMFAVNTGIWTATFALLASIMLHVFPSNLIYVLFGIPLGSIYCNTLLANLNARSYIRGDPVVDNIGAELAMGSPGASSDPKTMIQSGDIKFASSPFMNIRKTTEAITFTDMDRSQTTQNTV